MQVYGSTSLHQIHCKSAIFVKIHLAGKLLLAFAPGASQIRNFLYILLHCVLPHMTHLSF